MADPNRLRAILELVEESLAEPDLTGSELADRAYLSRYHFDRLVRAAIGEPPGAFRRRLMLERAAYQLDYDTASVIEVALEAGYASPDAFARIFARAYGKTPTDYRRAGLGDYRLPATNDIHFHPPGGLRLPAPERSNTMDVLTRMYEHHIRLTGEILERLGRLDDAALDRPIALLVEFIDDDPSGPGTRWATSAVPATMPRPSPATSPEEQTVSPTNAPQAGTRTPSGRDRRTA